MEWPLSPVRRVLASLHIWMPLSSIWISFHAGHCWCLELVKIIDCFTLLATCIASSETDSLSSVGNIPVQMQISSSKSCVWSEKCLLTIRDSYYLFVKGTRGHRNRLHYVGDCLNFPDQQLKRKLSMATIHQWGKTCGFVFLGLGHPSHHIIFLVSSIFF